MRRGHLGKGKTVFSFSSFSKGNSNVLGEKGGRIQGRKDFLDSYEKHLSSMNTTMKIRFFKKYNWHPFDLIYKKNLLLPSFFWSFSYLFTSVLKAFALFFPISSILLVLVHPGKKNPKN